MIVFFVTGLRQVGEAEGLHMPAIYSITESVYGVPPEIIATYSKTAR